MARRDSSPDRGARASLKGGRGGRERSHRSRCPGGLGAGSSRSLGSGGTRGREFRERRLRRSRGRRWPFLSTGPAVAGGRWAEAEATGADAVVVG